MNLKGCILRARMAGSQSETDGTTVTDFRFGMAEKVFEGHFPGEPILPGIFQLEMTRATAEEAAGTGLSITKIERAKFMSPIRPDEKVRLKLKLAEGAETIRARAEIFAEGRAAGEILLELARKT